VIGVSVPRLGAHDVGQLKSYGVVAHRRRAWLGGGSPSPRKPPPSRIQPDLLVALLAADALSEPGRGVAAHPRRSRLT
jgi:hypothetical protein